MTREIHNQIEASALERMEGYHQDVVNEVREAVKTQPVVVVGMAHNPFVKRATKALKQANIEFKYLEYGSYFSKWSPRLAIKLWSGWPNYPQIFVQGRLVGGAERLEKALADGSFEALLDGGR